MQRALVVVALLFGACRGAAQDGPPCGAVGAKFLALAKDDLAAKKTDETLRRAVLDQLPAMRDGIVQACTESKWSPAVRACLVQAGDHLAFEACEQQLTDAQRTDLDRAARGQPRDAN